MQEKGFSREDTKISKGIAIILMLIHHLWTFPDRLSNGGLTSFTAMLGYDLTIYMGVFGKICVSFFMFLGGYGMYLAYQKGKLSIAEKIKKLYFSYWKVFFIFIPIGFIFFSNQDIYCATDYICTKFSAFSIWEFIGNALGVISTYNEEWWFFTSYVIVILIFPLITKLIKNKPLFFNIWLVIIYSIIVHFILIPLRAYENLSTNYFYDILIYKTAPYVACFIMGCIMAKDNLLSKLENFIHKAKLLNIFCDIFFLILIIFLRTSFVGPIGDILFVPLFIIFCTDIINRASFIKKIMLALGNESTNMWLIHSFFCYYFYIFTKIILFPQHAVLVLLWLIFVTYWVSKALDKMYTYLGKILKKPNKN